MWFVVVGRVAEQWFATQRGKLNPAIPARSEIAPKSSNGCQTVVLGAAIRPESGEFWTNRAIRC